MEVQSAISTDIISEFKLMQADVDLINLQERIDAYETKENEFKAKYQERLDAKQEIPDEAASKVANQLSSTLSSLFVFIDTTNKYNPSEALDSAVEKINDIALKYNNMIKTRSTRRDNDKNQKPTDENEGNN